MKKIKLVIAGNAREFLGWCVKHRLNPHDYKYISCSCQMYGFRDCVIYRIGNYFTNPDIARINEYCVLHDIKNAYMKESEINENSNN